jgi:hypothetical protein
MKIVLTFLFAIALLIYGSQSGQLADSISSSANPSRETLDRLGISNPAKLSAASRRVIERGYDHGPEWYCEFTTHDLKGDLAFDPNVI